MRMRWNGRRGIEFPGDGGEESPLKRTPAALSRLQTTSFDTVAREFHSLAMRLHAFLHAALDVLASRRTRSTSVFVALLLLSIPAPAQNLALTKDSEFGFQRLIRSAQNGELGDDVTNVNVGVSPHRVQIELVRANGVNKLLFLKRKSSTQGPSRYFDIELGDAATASDAARVGTILDEAFEEDPFEVAIGPFGGQPTSHFPTLMQAWKDGGWTRVLWALEGQLTAPVGVRHAAAIVMALAIAVLASLILLWGSTP
jgi:hypothetical protein